MSCSRLVFTSTALLKIKFHILQLRSSFSSSFPGSVDTAKIVDFEKLHSRVITLLSCCDFHPPTCHQGIHYPVKDCEPSVVQLRATTFFETICTTVYYSVIPSSQMSLTGFKCLVSTSARNAFIIYTMFCRNTTSPFYKSK